jgi:hypothetical protein
MADTYVNFYIWWLRIAVFTHDINCYWNVEFNCPVYLSPVLSSYHSMYVIFRQGMAFEMCDLVFLLLLVNRWQPIIGGLYACCIHFRFVLWVYAILLILYDDFGFQLTRDIKCLLNGHSFSLLNMISVALYYLFNYSFVFFSWCID